MMKHSASVSAGIALALALGVATVSVASADQHQTVVLPPVVNLNEVSQPYIPELKLNEMTFPTIVASLKATGASTAIRKEKQSTPWWKNQPIPCNTNGLYTVGQLQSAYQACNDRFFNVDHSP